MSLETGYLQTGDALTLTISTVVLALATIALVCITAYYAKQTKKTVGALDFSAKLSVQPQLVCSMFPFSLCNILLRVSNIGNGPAKDIRLNWRIESLPNSQINWNSSILIANEKQEFFIQTNRGHIETSMAYFQNNQTNLIIEGEYVDILGERFSVNDTINATEFCTGLRQIAQRWEEDPMIRIARSLEDIKREMDRRRITERALQEREQIRPKKRVTKPRRKRKRTKSSKK